MNDLLTKALRIYPKLENQYLEFIANPEDKLNQLNGLNVIQIKDNILSFEVIGKLIELKFSMVLHNGQDALGQVSAFVVKNPENQFRSEKAILSIWFDSLGNIKNDLDNGFSMAHVTYDSSLSDLVKTALKKLLLSDEFAPRSHD